MLYIIFAHCLFLRCSGYFDNIPCAVAVVHIVTATYCSHARCRLFSTLLLYVVFLKTRCYGKHIDSHDKCLSIGLQCQIAITSGFQRNYSILLDIATRLEYPWIGASSSKPRRLCREQEQKRGCGAGLLARLRKQPLRLPLPSIFLTNARSIVHKINKLELYIVTILSIRTCCVLSQKPGYPASSRTAL